MPPSACPACKAPIKAWQNIPVISWLALRGRCAACKVAHLDQVSPVELATGLLLRLGGLALRIRLGAALCALLVTWTLIALTGIDIDHQLLPDS
jgi:leader peptidase (prepilin peptidase)/N-methyltransferase